MSGTGFIEYDESNFTNVDNHTVKRPVSAFVPAVQYKPFDMATLTKYGKVAGPSSLDLATAGSNFKLKTNEDGSSASPEGGFGLDGESLQGYAQLGGLAMQLLGYSDKKKYLKAQTAGLNQNIAQAKVDNAFKAATIANLNGGPKSVNTQTGMA